MSNIQTTITVNLGDVDHIMGATEARELYNQLHAIFGQQPIYYPVVYPQYPHHPSHPIHPGIVWGDKTNC